jgi:hypothetical protein
LKYCFALERLDSYFHGNNDLNRLENDSIQFTYENSDYQVLVLTGLNPSYACKKKRRALGRSVYFETAFYSSDGERLDFKNKYGFFRNQPYK